MEMIEIATRNDSNGNPRRCYVAIQDGEMLAAWDQGFIGSDAVPSVWRNLAQSAPRINVSPSEYRSCLAELPSPLWAHEVKGFYHLR